MQSDRVPFSLSGKTIIVTGASSGIGRQCAITCSERGASVVILGRDATRLDETLHALNEPLLHRSYLFDMKDCHGCDALIKEVVARSGRISGLVHCAGISTTLPLRMLTTEKMELFFQTNVCGAMMLTKAAVKPAVVSPDGASIIFVSSVMASVGEVGKSLYSMTKGALVAASRSLALEFAPKNIRVNSISPGVVETPMSQSAVYSQDADSLNRIKALHPLGLGRVEDVANTCLFLLSDEARWITGSDLVVDGGYTAR